MPRFAKFLAVPVCVGAGVAILVLLRQTNYGGGFSRDSFSYTALARDLVDGSSMSNTRFPPGFPSLLALVSVFGPAPREVAPLVNAIAFGLTVAVACIWFRLRLKSRILVVWGTCAIAFSTVISSPAAMALSETPFCLFMVLSLFSLDRYLSADNRRARPKKGETPPDERMLWPFSSRATVFLVLAAIFAAMASLTRWIGVTLILAGTLLLLIRLHTPLVVRIRHCIVYAIVSATPVGAWLAGIFLNQDSFFGSTGNWGSWAHNLCVAASEFTEWGIGRFGTGYLGKLCAAHHGLLNHVFDYVFNWTVRETICVPQLGLLLVFVFSATYLLCGIRLGACIAERSALASPVIFALIYTLALFISLRLTDIKIEVRYLMPLYVPLLFVAAVALDECYQRATSKSRINLSSFSLVTGLFLWTSQQLYVNYTDIASWLAHGGGKDFSPHHVYTTKFWKTSEILHYIKDADVGGRLWATNTIPLTEVMNIPAWQIPRQIPDRVADWPANPLVPGTVFVWHWAPERHLVDYIYGPEELLDTLPSLVVDRVFSDGIVLKVGAAGSNGRPGSRHIILDTLLQNTMQVVSAYYDVYLQSTQNRLIYVKKQCGEDGTDTTINLRVFAANDFSLPRHRIPFGSDHLDFVFERRAFRWGSNCIAFVPLPSSYEISGFWTGQTSNEEGWEVSLVRSSERGWRVLE